MLKSGIDQQALIDMFASASARQAAQLRAQVSQATLAALQGRELTLKNIRTVLKTVTKAVSTGASQNEKAGVDVESLLDRAVAGMDDALLKAVEANQRALQQFVDQGADLREKHLSKALKDLEQMEDTFITTLRKSSDAAGAGFQTQWAPVLEKMQAGGTLSGHKATETAEAFAQQMHDAVRQTRNASMKAAATLAESYAALVSGVLIGMSEAMAGQAPAAAKKSTRGR